MVATCEAEEATASAPLLLVNEVDEADATEFTKSGNGVAATAAATFVGEIVPSDGQIACNTGFCAFLTLQKNLVVVSSLSGTHAIFLHGKHVD